jgi:two-component system, OmpR family, sensor histidine kinase VanS
MKLSLQARLFMIVTGLILFFILLSWLLNSTLLDKYYLYNRKTA